MKHLPKHLRPRWRYLAVGIEAWPDAAPDRGRFQRALWRAARTLLGDAGSAAVDLSVLGFGFRDGVGDAVVRCRRGKVSEARAALACIESVDGDPVGVHVRGVSGTVRACEEKYIGRPLEPADQREVAFEGATRHAVGREDLVDVSRDGAFVGATELDFR